MTGPSGAATTAAETAADRLVAAARRAAATPTGFPGWVVAVRRQARTTLATALAFAAVGLVVGGAGRSLAVLR